MAHVERARVHGAQTCNDIAIAAAQAAVASQPPLSHLALERARPILGPALSAVLADRGHTTETRPTQHAA